MEHTEEFFKITDFKSGASIEIRSKNDGSVSIIVEYPKNAMSTCLVFNSDEIKNIIDFLKSVNE